MYRYESGSTTELTTTSVIDPGKGYWLIQKLGKQITTGAGTSVTADDDGPIIFLLYQVGTRSAIHIPSMFFGPM